mgnify:CR=1 FL=1
MSRRPGGSFVGVLAATAAVGGVAAAVGVAGDVLVVSSESLAVGGLSVLGAAAVLALAVASDPDVDDRRSVGSGVAGRRVAADGAGDPAEVGSPRGSRAGATGSSTDADGADTTRVESTTERESPEPHAVGAGAGASESTTSERDAGDSTPSETETSAMADSTPKQLGRTDATDWAFRDDEARSVSGDENEDEHAAVSVDADGNENGSATAVAPVEDAEWEFDPELAAPRDAE